jgi:hypothetical protein
MSYAFQTFVISDKVLTVCFILEYRIPVSIVCYLTRWRQLPRSAPLGHPILPNSSADCDTPAGAQAFELVIFTFDPNLE